MCSKLELVTYNVNMVDTNMKTDFPNIFRGLGSLKNFSHDFTLKDDPQPTCIYTPPRSAPLPLRDKVRETLDELEGEIRPEIINATDDL